jgi:hypothetical protein
LDLFVVVVGFGLEFVGLILFVDDKISLRSDEGRKAPDSVFGV